MRMALALAPNWRTRSTSKAGPGVQPTDVMATNGAHAPSAGHSRRCAVYREVVNDGSPRTCR
jgi:hypothetical protein